MMKQCLYKHAHTYKHVQTVYGMCMVFVDSFCFDGVFPSENAKYGC